MLSNTKMKPLAKLAAAAVVATVAFAGAAQATTVSTTPTTNFSSYSGSFTLTSASSVEVDVGVIGGSQTGYSLTGSTKPVLTSSTSSGVSGVYSLVAYIYSNLAAGTYFLTASGTKGSTVLTNVQVSAVPLPAALPLFGAALLGMGIIGYRRRNNAASAA